MPAAWVRRATSIASGLMGVSNAVGSCVHPEPTLHVECCGAPDPSSIDTHGRIVAKSTKESSAQAEALG